VRLVWGRRLVGLECAQFLFSARQVSPQLELVTVLAWGRLRARRPVQREQQEQQEPLAV
jgi:hypothetical protein